MSDFMWMRTPQEALDIIAGLIQVQASLKEQDRWLSAAISLKLVDVGEPNE